MKKKLNRAEIVKKNRQFCLTQPEEYYNKLKSDCNKYEINQPLGRGKYSEVYEGIDIQTGLKIVIKILKPVRYSKIQREILILKQVKNGPNIIKLLDICQDRMTKTPILVFEHFSPLTLKSVQKTINLQQLKYVMYQVFQSLEYCHSKGIIHRDVKPSNIIVNPETMQIKLIDWGLSEFYIQGNEYHTRVSSRPFKGPELLIGYKQYDYAMDIWSVGCMFGGFIFKKSYLFLGRDNEDQLREIVNFMGSEDFLKYAQKCNVANSLKNIQSLMFKEKKPFQGLINSDNKDLATKEALDLLNQMLIYDHDERITAKEALFHPFFNSVRDMFK